MSVEVRRASAPEVPSAAEGRRRWKNPNEVVRIRRKLSRKPSLKTPSEERARLKLVETKRTPVLKRTSENLITASLSPAKKSRGGLQDISNSPITLPPILEHNTSKPSNNDRILTDTISTDSHPPTTHPLASDTLPPPPLLSVPLDWSLKTKVRFTSPFPFSWTQSVRPHQEASGITNFTTNTGTNTSCSNQHAVLQEGLMLWVHPSLPFLKTYPRTTDSETRHRTHTATALLQDQQVLQSLRDDWSTSLCSVYQLLKCGHCPYFYLCANQFTVLFTAAGVRGCPSISAIITPTTSGMRDALRKEGAELNLPLAPPEGAGDEEEEYSDSEEGGATWLTNMGLPAKDLPRLRPQRAVIGRLQESRIDNRLESAVLVEGTSSVHVLFNFLLTSKTTISTTGNLAGVPPTILSPFTFCGATLRSLKVRQGNVRELVEGQMAQRYYLELTGPTLPHNLLKLVQLFHKTQHRQFTAQFTNIDSTGAFNGGEGATSVKDSTEPENYLHNPPLGQKHGLRQIVCDNGSVSWE